MLTYTFINYFSTDSTNRTVTLSLSWVKDGILTKTTEHTAKTTETWSTAPDDLNQLVRHTQAVTERAHTEGLPVPHPTVGLLDRNPTGPGTVAELIDLLATIAIDTPLVTTRDRYLQNLTETIEWHAPGYGEGTTVPVFIIDEQRAYPHLEYQARADGAILSPKRNAWFVADNILPAIYAAAITAAWFHDTIPAPAFTGDPYHDIIQLTQFLNKPGTTIWEPLTGVALDHSPSQIPPITSIPDGSTVALAGVFHRHVDLTQWAATHNITFTELPNRGEALPDSVWILIGTALNYNEKTTCAAHTRVAAYPTFPPATAPWTRHPYTNLTPSSTTRAPAPSPMQPHEPQPVKDERLLTPDELETLRCRVTGNPAPGTKPDYTTEANTQPKTSHTIDRNTYQQRITQNPALKAMYTKNRRTNTIALLKAAAGGIFAYLVVLPPVSWIIYIIVNAITNIPWQAFFLSPAYAITITIITLGLTARDFTSMTYLPLPPPWLIRWARINPQTYERIEQDHNTEPAPTYT